VFVFVFVCMCIPVKKRQEPILKNEKISYKEQKKPLSDALFESNGRIDIQLEINLQNIRIKH